MLGWGEGELTPHSLPALGGGGEHCYVIQQNLFKTIPTFSLTVCFVVNIFETITNKVLFKKNFHSLPERWVTASRVLRRRTKGAVGLLNTFEWEMLDDRIWDVILGRTFVHSHDNSNILNIGTACLEGENLAKICKLIVT